MTLQTLTPSVALLAAAWLSLAAAAGAQIRCDVKPPPGMSHIEIEDECGMSVPVDSAIAGEDTSIELPIESFPHRVSYRIMIDTGRVELQAGGEIVIFDMFQHLPGTDLSVLALRLFSDGEGKFALGLESFSDTGSIRLEGPALPPSCTLAVELTRSSEPGSADGRIRVLVDGRVELEAGSLRLWDGLPDAVRLGAVKVAGESTGWLRFQLLGSGRGFYNTVE